MSFIFSRPTQDDLEATKMATFMLDAGCSVISITCTGKHRFPGATADTAKYEVFAKADDRKQVDAADNAFGKWLNSLTPQSNPSGELK